MAGRRGSDCRGEALPTGQRPRSPGQDPEQAGRLGKGRPAGKDCGPYQHMAGWSRADVGCPTPGTVQWGPPKGGLQSDL